MPKATLYVGPPGSGKSYLASIECDIECDIVWKEDLLGVSRLEEHYLGLTNAQCIAESQVKYFIHHANRFGIDIQKVKAFIGDPKVLIKNVKKRQDNRKVKGMIDLWARSSYDPTTWKSLGVPVEILKVRDYS